MGRVVMGRDAEGPNRGCEVLVRVLTVPQSELQAASPSLAQSCQRRRLRPGLGRDARGGSGVSAGPLLPTWLGLFSGVDTPAPQTPQGFSTPCPLGRDVL